MAGAKRGLGRGLGALFGEDTIEEVIAEEKAADRKMANGADRIVEKNSARIQKKNGKKSTEKSDSEVGKVKNTDLNQKAQESEKQITAEPLRKIEKVSEKTEETVKSASSFAVKPEQEEPAQTELELKVSEIEPNQDQPRKAFDQEQLEAFLEEKNMLLFIRTHVAEQGSAAPYLGKRIRFLGNEQAEDVTGILNIFDCLITDYSSIYIDYLLTDKPMIFLPYDRQQYLDGRGMNFDYDDVTPGPKPETFNDFLDALSPKEDFWKSERTRVNRLFNEIQHPCAADICNKVLKMIR